MKPRIKKVIAGFALIVLIVSILIMTDTISSTNARAVPSNTFENEINSNELIEMEKLTKDAFLKKVFKNWLCTPRTSPAIYAEYCTY